MVKPFSETVGISFRRDHRVKIEAIRAQLIRGYCPAKINHRRCFIKKTEQKLAQNIILKSGNEM